jgi:hypothetical protein
MSSSPERLFAAITASRSEQSFLLQPFGTGSPSLVGA